MNLILSIFLLSFPQNFEVKTKSSDVKVVETENGDVIVIEKKVQVKATVYKNVENVDITELWQE